MERIDFWKTAKSLLATSGAARKCFNWSQCWQRNRLLNKKKSDERNNALLHSWMTQISHHRNGPKFSSEMIFFFILTLIVIVRHLRFRQTSILSFSYFPPVSQLSTSVQCHWLRRRELKLGPLTNNVFWWWSIIDSINMTEVPRKTIISDFWTDEYMSKQVAIQPMSKS